MCLRNGKRCWPNGTAFSRMYLYAVVIQRVGYFVNKNVKVLAGFSQDDYGTVFVLFVFYYDSHICRFKC